MAHSHVIFGAGLDTARPTVRTITLDDLKDALMRGLDDFRAMPSHAVFLCLIYPIVGFVLSAVLVILSATTFADRQELIEAEFYVMTLFSTSGLMLMVAGNELMSIYLALEVTSLSLAFLAAWNKRDTIAGQGLKSTEAGIKFFLLSAMSTAILLYGMALLYGATGSTTLDDISRVITGTPTPAALLSITMLIAGLGFKIAAAPFQLWTPDVYQGAATPATAFFSVGSKAAGFAVLLRIFNGALPGISAEWTVLSEAPAPTLLVTTLRNPSFQPTLQGPVIASRRVLSRMMPLMPPGTSLTTTSASRPVSSDR